MRAATSASTRSPLGQPWSRLIPPKKSTSMSATVTGASVARACSSSAGIRRSRYRRVYRPVSPSRSASSRGSPNSRLRHDAHQLDRQRRDAAQADLLRGTHGGLHLGLAAAAVHVSVDPGPSCTACTIHERTFWFAGPRIGARLRLGPPRAGHHRPASRATLYGCERRADARALPRHVPGRSPGRAGDGCATDPQDLTGSPMRRLTRRPGAVYASPCALVSRAPVEVAGHGRW